MAVTIRDYKNYEDYLAHQKEKTECPKRRQRLEKQFLERKEYFILKFEYTIFHFPYIGENKNLKVVCLGSRMGEEVAALQEMGFNDCIGTDLIAREPYVIVEDFHDLSFESETIGMFYTNSLDHSCKPKQMLQEAHRCLKTGGHFIIDFFPRHMGKHEACKIEYIADVLSLKPSGLRLVDKSVIVRERNNFCIELIFRKDK